MSRKTSTRDGRLLVLSVVFGVFSLVIAFRLFTLQVLDHSKYKAMAQEQYWNYEDIPAKRGDILSSDNFPLASTQNYFLMYGEPQNITDKYKTANLLAEKLELYAKKQPSTAVTTEKAVIPAQEDVLTFKSVQERILNAVNTKLLWVILAKGLTPIQKEEIAALQLKGVGFEDQPVRFYPERTLAAHVLGFVASDDKGNDRGYYGIEGSFDGDLRGKAGKMLQEKDALGSPILVGGFKKTDSINGRSLKLTINRAVQYLVEKKLQEAVQKYDAEFGTVIVMNPQNGDVIAMANYPTYDPADFSQEELPLKENEHRKNVERKNNSIADTYEPGSVMKPFTVASAIDLKLVSPETTFTDEGPVNYSGYFIDNWNRQHYGVQTVTQLLQKSNNIGAAWVGHQVGAHQLYNYFEKFGFGQKTGIDLEGEDSGILRDAADWTDIDLANVSFGQGMSATPLQVLTAFNVFLNGGQLLLPRIVASVSDGEKTMELPVKVKRSAISANTAHTMKNLLIQAVEGGESKFFNTKKYVVGGKTGTAQIPVNGVYDEKKSNATFIGFPAATDKLSMIVRLKEPTTSIYAAETAVPLWMALLDDIAEYYGVMPDKEPQ